MISYEGQVVVVTGGGEGSIGEAHAKSFAKRGACVVVNDINVEAADATVESIINTNGQSIANYDSVLDGIAIIEQTLDIYGRIDVMLNNAGIDGVGPEGPLNVGEISEDFWRETLDVHLMGTFACTKAALKPMQEQGSGRVIITSSPTGLFGCTGDNAYATAKAALFGFMQCVALEYKDQGITCNALVPVSAGGTTRAHLSEEWVARAHAEYVSEFAAWLAHGSCSVSGKAFEVGGGYIHPLRIQMGAGIYLEEANYSAEAIADHAQQLSDFTDSFYPDVGEITVVLNKIAEKAGIPPMEAAKLPRQPR